MKHPGKSKNQQKRKHLLMIPILTFPFLTLAFWALGGGTKTESFPPESSNLGFKLELPGITAKKEQELDKLGHYQRSKIDSSKYLQEVKKDPYYQMAFSPKNKTEELPALSPLPINPENPSSTTLPLYHDPQEELILNKLEELSRTLYESPEQISPVSPQKLEGNSFTNSTHSKSDLGKDLDRLDQMMQQMQSSDSEPDPEFQQMAELLDKILDIQHPQRVQHRLEIQKANSTNELTSSKRPSGKEDFTLLENISTTIEPTSNPLQNGFYGLETQNTSLTTGQSIQAVIHEDQTLVSGETVKIRLTQEASISGYSIPKDQLVYGRARLNGDRLSISIEQIRIQNQLIPVDLSIHDADGLQGIRIPGTISQQVSSQSGSQSIQGLGISTFDNSLEAQAASAGIQTAKSFLSKKIKQTKVSLKAGYQVWILEKM